MMRKRAMIVIGLLGAAALSAEEWKARSPDEAHS